MTPREGDDQDCGEPGQIVSLTRSLVAINSANPATYPQGPGEAELVRYCAAWCTERSLSVTITAEPEDRPSLVVESAGTGRGPSVLLVGHLDSFLWWDPSHTRAPSRRLFGPGALDMKAGLAAILIVLDRLHRAGHCGRLRGVLTADEEHRSLGLRGVLPVLRGADAAIVLESTGLRVGLAHPGRVMITAARPSEVAWRELRAALCRWSSSAPARLDVALQPHGVAFRAQIAPNTNAQLIAGQLAARIEPLAPITYLHSRAAFDGLGSGATVIAAALTRAAKDRGLGAAATTLTGWTEAGMLAAAGIPSVVFGPGGHGAHTRGEWVDTEQTVLCLEVLTDTVRRLLASNWSYQVGNSDPIRGDRRLREQTDTLRESVCLEAPGRAPIEHDPPRGRFEQPRQGP